MEERNLPLRHYDLDWLRVLAIAVVFVFHSLRFFTLEDWIVKNSTTYLVIENLANYLECWLMPLFFTISGASIYFESRKSKPIWKLIQDKALRLLVPLLVGIFTQSILQVYLERLSHGNFSGSFLTFLPHYFDGLYGLGGNFAWVGLHLWYLEVLFVFSIVFLPVSLWMKTSTGGRLLAKLGDLLAVPGMIYLLSLGIILSWKLLNPDSPLGRKIFGWPLGMYFSFFLAGYLFTSDERLVESICRQRWFSLIGSLVATVLFFVTQDHADLVVWLVILAYLGLARQHLNFSSPFIRYTNQAVLPFYILHQPVLLSIGFFVVLWHIPDPLKYLVIAVPAFLLTLGLYEFLVRRSNLLRFLFGMKLAPLTSRRAVIASLGRLNL